MRKLRDKLGRRERRANATAPGAVGPPLPAPELSASFSAAAPRKEAEKRPPALAGLPLPHLPVRGRKAGKPLPKPFYDFTCLTFPSLPPSDDPRTHHWAGRPALGARGNGLLHQDKREASFIL